MQAEHVRIMWQQRLDLWRLQKEASEKASEAVEVEAGARRGDLAALAKEEVKREPVGLGDAPTSTSTQSGAGDVSSGPESTMLSQIQNLLNNNNKKSMETMGTMQNVMPLNATKLSLSITQVENRLVKTWREKCG